MEKGHFVWNKKIVLPVNRTGNKICGICIHYTVKIFTLWKVTYAYVGMTSNSTLDQKYSWLLNPWNPTTLFSLLHALTGMFIAGRPFFIPHTQVISKKLAYFVGGTLKGFFWLFSSLLGIGEEEDAICGCGRSPRVPCRRGRNSTLTRRERGQVKKKKLQAFALKTRLLEVAVISRNYERDPIPSRPTTLAMT